MAAKPTTVTVTIVSLERLNNSVNGNPRFKIHTDGGWYITSSDHGFCYSIENDWRGKDTRDAVLTLTRAGRVCDLDYVDNAIENRPVVRATAVRLDTPAALCAGDTPTC